MLNTQQNRNVVNQYYNNLQNHLMMENVYSPPMNLGSVITGRYQDGIMVRSQMQGGMSGCGMVGCGSQCCGTVLNTVMSGWKVGDRLHGVNPSSSSGLQSYTPQKLGGMYGGSVATTDMMDQVTVSSTNPMLLNINRSLATNPEQPQMAHLFKNGIDGGIEGGVRPSNIKKRKKPAPKMTALQREMADDKINTEKLATKTLIIRAQEEDPIILTILKVAIDWYSRNKSSFNKEYNALNKGQDASPSTIKKMVEELLRDFKREGIEMPALVDDEVLNNREKLNSLMDSLSKLSGHYHTALKKFKIHRLVNEIVHPAKILRYLSEVVEKATGITSDEIDISSYQPRLFTDNEVVKTIKKLSSDIKSIKSVKKKYKHYEESRETGMLPLMDEYTIRQLRDR